MGGSSGTSLDSFERGAVQLSDCHDYAIRQHGDCPLAYQRHARQLETGAPASMSLSPRRQERAQPPSTFTAAASGYTSATIITAANQPAPARCSASILPAASPRTARCFPFAADPGSAWKNVMNHPAMPPIRAAHRWSNTSATRSGRNGGAGTGRTIQQTVTEITGMGINVIRLPRRTADSQRQRPAGSPIHA